MKRALALAALAMPWTQAAPAAEDPRPAQSREIAARLSKETMAKHYPAGQANGFAVGNLRGAFAIERLFRTETRP